jgi:hypothetical protein
MPGHVRNALMGHVNENRHAEIYGGDVEWLEVKREHIERMNCIGVGEDTEFREEL